MTVKIHARKATQQQTRTYNSNLVLKTIYDQGRVSRADVARLTHLTRTSVSEMVAELQERGLVHEVGIGRSIGGRSPILLSVIEDARHLISLDLSSAGFRGAVVNLRNEIIGMAEITAPTGEGTSALDRVYKLIETLQAATDKPILGIGIGTPGLVDTTNGIIVRAVNLGWHNLPIRDLLHARYNLPVYVANDSQIGALAHNMFKHDLASNLVLIKIGQGVGAGIVLNGQLYQGDGFGAGEIGHVVVEEGGEQCPCGNYGCLETVISDQGIIRRARALAATHPESTLNTHDDLTLDRIAAAARAGDEAALSLVAATAHYLAIACANLVSALNIRLIVLAGSITAFGAPLLDKIRREAAQRSLPTLANATVIELDTPNPDAVIHGASVLVITNELGFSLTR